MTRLRPPIQGLQRRFDLQSQPPYTTPDCSNVVPTGAERRARVSRRPGAVKAFTTQLGDSGDRVCDLLTSMNLAPGEAAGLPVPWRDDFSDYNTDNGESPTNPRADLPDSRYTALGAEPLLQVRIADDIAVSLDASGVGAAAVLKDEALTDFDHTKPYTVLATGNTAQRFGFGVQLQVFALLDNTSPSWDPGVSGRGVRAMLSIGASVAAVTFTDADGDVTSAPGGTFPIPGPRATFGLRVTPGGTNDTFEVLLNGDVVHSVTRPTQNDAAKRRVGVAIKAATGVTYSAENSSIESLSVNYRTPGATAINNLARIVVAAANGTLYRERDSGVLETVTTAAELAGEHLQAAEWGGRLYIADGPSDIAEGLNKTITAGGVLTDTGAFTDVVNDWHIVRLTDPTTGAALGCFNISAHTDDTITLEGYAASASDSVDYVVYNAIKEFDPQTDTVTPLVPTVNAGLGTGTKGLIPDGIELIARYNDRLVMARDRLWYMSRAGDPYDYDYAPAAASDPTKAVASTVTEAGRIGEPIRALITHSDDYLIFACEESCYILRGDPGWYGRQGPLSHHVGIVHRDAWCATPEGGTLMLSRFGLYYIQPGGGGTPQPVSEDVLPDALRNLDTTTPVYMAYDPAARGVWILRGRSGFFFDWAMKGWWPISVPYAIDALHRYVGLQSDESGVLMAHEDGYIRRWKPTAADDDGTPILSYVTIGPVRIGGSEDTDGVLRNIRGDLATSSAEATWQILVANSPEQAVKADPFPVEGTWQAGANKRTYVRARGAAMCVKISGAGEWELDSVIVHASRRGRARGG